MQPRAAPGFISVVSLPYSVTKGCLLYTSLDVFEHVYKHECHVSELIDKLVDVASAEKDKASQDFLWGFVRRCV